ncbi:hypothetical protein ABLN72_16535 [Mycobacterium tuberculosis]
MFNLQTSQHFHCFRIYRETLSRFSCAAYPSCWYHSPSEFR